MRDDDCKHGVAKHVAKKEGDDVAAINVKGTLYWETGLPARQSGRVEGAVVKYHNGTTTDSVITDDDGDFEITGVEDSKELALVLLHEGGRSSSITFGAGDFNDPLELRITAIEGPRAALLGGVTLIALIVALFVLTFNYLNAHQATMSEASTSYAALIEALKSVPTTPEAATPTALTTQQNNVRAAKSAVDELRTPLGDELDALIVSIVTYRRAADAEDLSDLAALIESAVDDLRNPVGRFFWNKWPWRLVEVWAWGLFGVLLTKITRIGWYLRTSSYLANGTWMHFAQVIATPFLALVAVLVLSFIKIEGESQTIVDFGNPLLMVVTACLLSTNPWGLWDFVLGQGDALRTKAKDTTTK